jgi:hypothetical protein
MPMSPAKPQYASQYYRFVETLSATDAEMPDFRMVSYDTTKPFIKVANAAGEVLGISTMYLEAKSAQKPYTLSRLMPVANSGILAIDSDGTLLVGDLVKTDTQGRATKAAGSFAVTLNSKDLIVREVVNTGGRQQVKVAV